MSCDENKKAQQRDQATRSLPILAEPAPAAAPQAAPPASRRYWRSLEEKRGSQALAAAAAREFPPGASELGDNVSRRGFIQLLGSSAALAGVGVACAKPNEKIVPYVRRPEEVTPGNSQHFATSYALEGFASGLLVESHEGRPTKIEGNPAHPSSQGASTALEQALILGLYDDDRARQLTHQGKPIAWRSLLTDISRRTPQLTEAGGAGLRFLTEPTASPLLGDLRRRLLERYPKAKVVSYSSIAPDGAAEGARLSFGKPMQARHDAARASVILSLDADFLGDGPEQVKLARGFSARREPGPNMSRVYVVEPAPTVTGTMADHRLRLRGSDVAAFTLALVGELGRRPGFDALAPFATLARSQAAAGPWSPRWLAALATDLDKSRGRSLVIAGRRQPAAVHALVNVLNSSLGNVGSTVSWSPAALPDGASGPMALAGLAGDMAAGLVDTLVITARNPAYTAPADFNFAKLLRRIPHTIYHALHEDETAAACNTLIPAAHALESWGDGQALDGTLSIVQPLIAPLWGGIGESEVLSAFLDEGDLGAHQILRRYWQTRADRPGAGVDFFDHIWEKWLADGVVPDTAGRPEGETVQIDGATLAGALGPLLVRKGDGLEIAFAPDPKVHDGRFANNAWLQELPHPITKLTWDNAVLVSPATARKLGLANGDVVEIAYRQRSLEAPVMIEPGHADEAITLPLGYGRAGAESVARGVGFDAGSIRNSDAPWFDRGATLTKIARGFKLAITQDHWTMAPDGRTTPEPALDTTLADLQKQSSEFNQEIEGRRGMPVTIHQPVDYSHQQYKWAMAIDLNKCTGCNACVVACQSENNIPVVGKDYVAKGREMQWIRIDRYFKGSEDDPEFITQPLACVHCETAPCEYVCPVNATVHSDEGLNEMVYNRCIGTRYCSNNCPYKVRRFNFIDYTSETSGARMMGMNPEVTVRARGVMEKCTYCVQRIEKKRIETRLQGRTIEDGELQTACQQGCPSQAISFGSLNDASSTVSRLHADARRYDLLHELGTRPRTAYLARVKNPNPELGKGE